MACYENGTAQKAPPCAGETRPVYFCTTGLSRIELPQHIVKRIAGMVGVRPGSAPWQGSTFAALLGGAGSATKAWRLLVKEVMAQDERAYLTVSGACAAAECLFAFPQCTALRIRHVVRACDVAIVLMPRLVLSLDLSGCNAIRRWELMQTVPYRRQDVPGSRAYLPGTAGHSHRPARFS